MRTAIWNFCLLLLVTYAFANEVYMYDQSNLFQSFLRIKRDAPVARPLGYYSEVRRSPSNFLRAIGPLAFGHKIGDDTKLPINGLGLLGAGDSEQIVAKFIPEGSENEPFNGGTYSLSDTPNMGYMTRETATGEQSGSSAKASIAGLGTIKVSDVREQGTGLLDFSKKILPFLELPKLKSDQDGDRENTDVDERIGDYFYIKENNNNQNYEPISESAFKPATPFKEVQELLNMANGKNGGGQNRPQPRMLAAKTVEDGDLLDENKKQSSDQEGFIEEETKEESEPDSPFTNSESKTPIKQKVQTFTGRVPIKQLGLSKKEIYDLCLKFSKVAAQVCYGPKIPEALVAKCQGYNEDCGEFQAQAKPLGAVANAFSSGVGLTYYDWGVNGIPYYPVNEEGGVGNGHHGKIDFGSWGGGYSNNLGVRDFWSQTGEYGANWYEGTYGYKTGWSVPIGQSLGVEGGAGTQVHVPLKEGELGKPIQVTNGYHVGPFIGLADRVGVDWYNGGISFNKGMAVPLIGVNVNSGTSIGFPSMGHIMNRMGLNGIEYMNDVVSDSSTTLNTQMSEKLGLS